MLQSSRLLLAGLLNGPALYYYNAQAYSLVLWHLNNLQFTWEDGLLEEVEDTRFSIY